MAGADVPDDAEEWSDREVRLFDSVVRPLGKQLLNVKHIVVPAFQRAFSWGAEHASTLFRDILAAWLVERAGPGFAVTRPSAVLSFGTVIVQEFARDHTKSIGARLSVFSRNALLTTPCKAAVSPGGEDKTWVLIDGQQRLTTLALLSAVMATAAVELNRGLAERAANARVLEGATKAQRGKLVLDAVEALAKDVIATCRSVVPMLAFDEADFAGAVDGEERVPMGHAVAPVGGFPSKSAFLRHVLTFPSTEWLHREGAEGGQPPTPIQLLAPDPAGPVPDADALDIAIQLSPPPVRHFARRVKEVVVILVKLAKEKFFQDGDAGKWVEPDHPLWGVMAKRTPNGHGHASTMADISGFLFSNARHIDIRSHEAREEANTYGADVPVVPLQLSGLVGLRQLALFLRHRCTVTSVKTTDSIMALTAYRDENARGVSLQAPEVVKAELLYTAETAGEFARAHEGGAGIACQQPLAPRMRRAWASIEAMEERCPDAGCAILRWARAAIELDAGPPRDGEVDTAVERRFAKAVVSRKLLEGSGLARAFGPVPFEQPAAAPMVASDDRGAFFELLFKRHFSGWGSVMDVADFGERTELLLTRFLEPAIVIAELVTTSFDVCSFPPPSAKDGGPSADALVNTPGEALLHVIQDAGATTLLRDILLDAGIALPGPAPSVAAAASASSSSSSSSSAAASAAPAGSAYPAAAVDALARLVVRLRMAAAVGITTPKPALARHALAMSTADASPCKKRDALFATAVLVYGAFLPVPAKAPSDARPNHTGPWRAACDALARFDVFALRSFSLFDAPGDARKLDHNSFLEDWVAAEALSVRSRLLGDPIGLLPGAGSTSRSSSQGTPPGPRGGVAGAPAAAGIGPLLAASQELRRLYQTFSHGGRVRSMLARGMSSTHGLALGNGYYTNWLRTRRRLALAAYAARQDEDASEVARRVGGDAPLAGIEPEPEAGEAKTAGPPTGAGADEVQCPWHGIGARLLPELPPVTGRRRIIAAGNLSRHMWGHIVLCPGTTKKHPLVRGLPDGDVLDVAGRQSLELLELAGPVGAPADALQEADIVRRIHRSNELLVLDLRRSGIDIAVARGEVEHGIKMFTAEADRMAKEALQRKRDRASVEAPAVAVPAAQRAMGADGAPMAGGDEVHLAEDRFTDDDEE